MAITSCGSAPLAALNLISGLLHVKTDLHRCITVHFIVETGVHIIDHSQHMRI
jgi:hypothetical protein